MQVKGLPGEVPGPMVQVRCAGKQICRSLTPRQPGITAMQAMQAMILRDDYIGHRTIIFFTLMMRASQPSYPCQRACPYCPAVTEFQVHLRQSKGINR